MTPEIFKKIITFYGEADILGFGFDNSSGVTFDGNHPFSLAQHYVDDIECITLIGFDSKGSPFHIVKHIENIQAIYVRDKNYDMNGYDRVTVRG